MTDCFGFFNFIAFFFLIIFVFFTMFKEHLLDYNLVYSIYYIYIYQLFFHI